MNYIVNSNNKSAPAHIHTSKSLILLQVCGEKYHVFISGRSVNSVHGNQCGCFSKSQRWIYLKIQPNHLGRIQRPLGPPTDACLFVHCFSILFSFHNLFIFIYITHQSQPLLLSSQFCPYKFLPPILPHLLLRKGEAPLGYHPTLRHPVSARLSASSSTEAQPCSQVKRRDPMAGNSQRQPPLQLLENPYEDQATSATNVQGA